MKYIKKNYKKLLVIICIFIIILFGVAIFGRKPSYEEIKKKLEFTKYIVVYDLTADKKVGKQINDTKIIKDITAMLSNAKMDNSEWENLTANKYRLEFYNDKKIIVQVLINTSYSNPVHIKYKNYDYSLKVEQIELLNNTIDDYIQSNS